MGGRAPLLLIHGVGCTGDAWSAMAGWLTRRGRQTRAPTLAADRRLAANPPADLPRLTLQDYVDGASGWAQALATESGRTPVVVGHSMGGLIAQKLAEAGLASAAVLLTPAAPAQARGPVSLAPLFTFANIVLTSKPETKAHKIWKRGFRWGVLNRVPSARHDAIYAGAVYDSGQVYADLTRPPEALGRSTAVVDPARIACPLLVIGAAQDRTTPAAGVKRIAEFYGDRAEHREYAGHAHWMVDEPGSDRVAADIADWLDAKGV